MLDTKPIKNRSSTSVFISHTLVLTTCSTNSFTSSANIWRIISKIEFCTLMKKTHRFATIWSFACTSSLLGLSWWRKGQSKMHSIFSIGQDWQTRTHLKMKRKRANRYSSQSWNNKENGKKKIVNLLNLWNDFHISHRNFFFSRFPPFVAFKEFIPKNYNWWAKISFEDRIFVFFGICEEKKKRR